MVEMNGIFRIIRLNKIKFNQFSKITTEIIDDAGTGFFISKDGDFLTAGHVLKQDNTVINFALIDGEPYPINSYPLANKLNNSGGLYMKPVDLAIGKIDKVTDYYFELKIINTVCEGDKLFIKGFSRNLSPEDDKYLLEKRDQYNIAGYCIGAKCFELAYTESSFIIIYDKLIGSPKNLSGSPVFDEKKKIAGILTGGNPKIKSGIVLHMDIIKKMIQVGTDL